jgi:hypothetical protein
MTIEVSNVVTGKGKHEKGREGDKETKERREIKGEE